MNTIAKATCDYHRKFWPKIIIRPELHIKILMVSGNFEKSKNSWFTNLT